MANCDLILQDPASFWRTENNVLLPAQDYILIQTDATQDDRYTECLSVSSDPWVQRFIRLQWETWARLPSAAKTESPWPWNPHTISHTVIAGNMRVGIRHFYLHIEKGVFSLHKYGNSDCTLCYKESLWSSWWRATVSLFRQLVKWGKR